MKIMKRIVILPILFFLLIGCATTTNLKLVDPSGRELPNPHYILRGMSNGITATFYYVAMFEQKDIDGTIISRPKYLPMNKIYEAKPTTKLLLVIEVSNPKKITYKLWSESNLRYWEKAMGRHKSTFAASLLAKSKLEYRQFIVDMPVNQTLKDVSFGVNLFDKSGNIVMYFGDFRYQIKK